MNSAFGANVPFLVDLILKELDIERRTRDTDPATSGRAYYELHEMTPIERKRFDVIQKADEENERIEQESALKRRVEYLTLVTNKIMDNANDMGVTIIAHVMNRDLLKRLTEQADKCRLVAKDKKNIQVLSDHAEILALCSTETMPKRFFDYILNRDIYALCWKLTDSNVDGDKNVEGGNNFETVFVLLFTFEVDWNRIVLNTRLLFLQFRIRSKFCTTRLERGG